MAGLHKILLVEDSNELRDMYETFLTIHNFEVGTAIDGEDGIKKAREFQPDLIFLDIMMPKMDGLEVLHILRSDASYNCQKTKIVLLTNLGSTEKLSQNISKDIDGYVIKAEISLSDLLDIIDSLKS